MLSYLVQLDHLCIDINDPGKTEMVLRMQTIYD